MKRKDTKHAVRIMALAGLVALGGCIPSLHGIYTQKDLVFRPALVGVWARDDSPERWEFTRRGENAYGFVFSDRQGRTGRFVAHLAKVGESLFLDFYPEETTIAENDFYKWHFLPLHTFYRVEFAETSFSLSSLDYGWLKELLKTEPGALRHEAVDGKIVLTASTAELQAFVIKHADTEGAFTKPVKFVRSAPPEGSATG